MKALHPKHAILPAILTAATALILLSTKVNSGYASSKSAANHIEEIKSINQALSLSSKFPEEIQYWKPLIEQNAQITGLDPN